MELAQPTEAFRDGVGTYLRAITVPALDAKGKEGMYLLRACDAASKDACM